MAATDAPPSACSAATDKNRSSSPAFKGIGAPPSEGKVPRRATYHRCPPEPERAPAPLSAETLHIAAVRQRLHTALRQAVESSLIQLVPGANLDGLAGELLAAMADVAGAPNRAAALTEWLLDRDEVEDVFATDEEVMNTFTP